MNATTSRTRHRRHASTLLRARHVHMIGFGGTIGAGIFLGSGGIIAATGPAAVLCYVVVGVLVVAVMRLLGALVQRDPEAGSFVSLTGKAFGRIGRFAIGWMYWWLLVVVVGVQAGVAASIAHSWLPQIPEWAWILLLTGALTLVNLGPVRVFGEFQFWLTLTKVVLCVAVPVVALLAVAGLLPGTPSPGVSNVTGHGGFFPNGWESVLAGILVAAFSFTGIEMTTIAAADADRPARVASRSLRFVTYFVVACYLCQVAATVVLVPWNDPVVAGNPFGAVLGALRIPAAASVVKVVLFLAVLSVLNSCLYCASRVGLVLADHGDAPSGWRWRSTSRTPGVAVCSAALVGMGVALIGLLAPGKVFLALVDSSGAVGIMVWLAIAASYLVLKSRDAARYPLTTPSRRLFHTAWISIIAMVAVLVGMLFLPQTQTQLVMTTIPVTAIFIVVLMLETNPSANP